MTRRLLLGAVMLGITGTIGVATGSDVPVSESVKIAQTPGDGLSVPLAGAFVGRVDGKVIVAGGLKSADAADPLDP